VFSQSRSTKVFAAALISISVGAAILKILGNNPPPAGAFSLSEYNHLGQFEKLIFANIEQSTGKWNHIDISYDYTKSIGTARRSSPNDPINYDYIHYHFIVWDGFIGVDGQIQATNKWQRQTSAIPGSQQNINQQTIRIGVIVDKNVAFPTNLQIKKTEALVEALSRRFDINPVMISYPDNWW